VTRAELILAHQKLAWRLVNALHDKLPLLDPDDLFQEAQVGLLLAADTYDPRRGASFATWAMWKMRGETTTFIRRQIGDKVANGLAVLSLSAPVNNGSIGAQHIGERGDELIDTIASADAGPEDLVASDEIRRDARETAAQFGDRRGREVVDRRMRSETQAQIADAMDASVSLISSIERDLLRKVRGQPARVRKRARHRFSWLAAAEAKARR
jgi:RNA polymerase sigma factor (sigma-70 family)